MSRRHPSYKDDDWRLRIAKENDRRQNESISCFSQSTAIRISPAYYWLFLMLLFAQGLSALPNVGESADSTPSEGEEGSSTGTRLRSLKSACLDGAGKIHAANRPPIPFSFYKGVPTADCVLESRGYSTIPITPKCLSRAKQVHEWSWMLDEERIDGSKEEVIAWRHALQDKIVDETSILQKEVTKLWKSSQPIAGASNWERLYKMKWLLTRLERLKESSIRAAATREAGRGYCLELSEVSLDELLKWSSQSGEPIRVQRLHVSIGNRNHAFLVINGELETVDILGDPEAVADYLSRMGGTICDPWNLRENGLGFFGKNDGSNTTYTAKAGWKHLEMNEYPPLVFDLDGLPDQIAKKFDDELDKMGYTRLIPPTIPAKASP